MIKKVYKYGFAQDDQITIKLPEGAEILSVQTQHDVPFLWALVDPDAPIVDRYFRIAGTGHSICYDMGIEYKFIGTFQMISESIVFHLFEIL